MGSGSGLWIMIAVIVVAGSYFDYKKSTAKLSNKMDNIEDGVMQRELSQIRQRLAVLEKIITDKNYDLNEELADLHSDKESDMNKQRDMS